MKKFLVLAVGAVSGVILGNVLGAVWGMMLGIVGAEDAGYNTPFAAFLALIQGVLCCVFCFKIWEKLGDENLAYTGLKVGTGVGIFAILLCIGGLIYLPAIKMGITWHYLSGVAGWLPWIGIWLYARNYKHQLLV